MTAICLKCRSELSITGDWGGQEVACPQCKRVIRLPAKSEMYSGEVHREYKLLSQKDLFQRRGYTADGILNELAKDGWRVVCSSTYSIDEFSLAAHRNELVVILERVTPVV